MRHHGSLICIFVVLISPVACAQEAEDLMLEQIIEAAEARTGNLEIRGRVESSDGEELRDVTIEYFFRELGDVVLRKEIDRKTITVDGEFRIRKNDVSSLNLWILKDGFYPERWSYAFDETSPREDPKYIETIDLVFTLTRVPAPAALKKIRGILRTDSQGAVAVVEVKRESSRETYLRYRDQQIENVWPYVYLEATMDSNGELAKAKYLPEGERAEIDVLERSRIHLSQPSPGDGFLVYDPGEIPYREALVFREMVEAPAIGYTSELEIPIQGNPRMVYFFCRFQGQYGKGMISGQAAVVSEDGREEAVAGISIFLNPTGDRNVSYVHN